MQFHHCSVKCRDLGLSSITEGDKNFLEPLKILTLTASRPPNPPLNLRLASIEYWTKV